MLPVSPATRNSERTGARKMVERTDTVVIGGGQSGLSVGYHLKRQGVPFVILAILLKILPAWGKTGEEALES